MELAPSVALDFSPCQVSKSSEEPGTSAVTAGHRLVSVLAVLALLLGVVAVARAERGSESR